MRATLALAAVVAAAIAAPAFSADLIGFWDQQRKGGNSFNEVPPDAAYFKALADTGATWVRLSFSKWPGQGRDFLIGDADDYKGIPAADLATLRATLDAADAAGLKVVVTPLSLPGARWRQQNDGKFDDRLWSNPAFADQAAQFWTDLATALRDHPAVAGYNIVNEPAPEKTTDLPENATMAEIVVWQTQVTGTPRDLPDFYEKVVAAIRAVDPVTPVMVDGGYYANPRALASWPRRLSDDRVLYAIHMYEPHEATSAPNMRRKTPLRYPGAATDYAGTRREWDAPAVADHIGLAYDWAGAQGIAPSHVVTAEFGCMRLWADCGAYLRDVIAAVDARGGSWAFYSFREDGWEGMDYELPDTVKPGQFYWLSEQGKADRLPRNGPLMDLLRAQMAE